MDDEFLDKIFKYKIGQNLYLKQEIVNDRSRMSVNGEKVDEWDLQRAIYPIGRRLFEEGPGSYTLQYIVRKSITLDNAEMGVYFEHELIPQSEAVAIIRMKQLANKT